jgi:hypothetical protein
MSLSIEIERYITTGRCPYCGVAILSSNYISLNSIYLRGAANHFASKGKTSNYLAFSAFLAPPRVKAKVIKLGQFPAMQCLSCMRYWYFVAWHAAIAYPFSSIQPRTGIIPSTPSPLGSVRRVLTGPSLSQPPRKVDLSGCALVGVTGEKQVEKFLSEQRKMYRNNSGSTVTRELNVTGSWTLTVTTESSKLQSHNAAAGVTLFGFAAIQGRVQRQLSERYSVTSQSTSSVSDKTSVTLKPYMTVEHVIQWKVVTWIGTALLGKPTSAFPGAIAQVPYQVPVRLTYDDDIIDVNNVQTKKKRR